MAFLVVWFVGDVTNLVGGLWAHLVPVVLAIAVYFCIADVVLLSQCIYYNFRNARREKQRRDSVQSILDSPTPTTPLLGRRFSDELPSSGRRRSSAASFQRRASHPDSTLAKIVEESESGAKAWLKNVFSIIAIVAIGAGGWAIAWQTGVWKPAPVVHDGNSHIAPGAQFLGYLSAICYLGYVLTMYLMKVITNNDCRARLPQIYKNYNEKSCEGMRSTPIVRWKRLLTTFTRSFIALLHPISFGQPKLRSRGKFNLDLVSLH
jgi:solute carrier family 66 (lysosomal lysine-arginine transporter), member 1